MYYDGHKIIICNGYPCIYLPKHKRAYSAGWVYIHILQAEKMLGRELDDVEVIHHKDENRMNYDISNLIVFASESDHQAYHMGCTKVLSSDGTYYCPDKAIRINYSIYKFCSCGNLCLESSPMCRECYNKLIAQKSYIDRDYLKSLIRNNSFEECGRILGCTGNAVKKKCKKLDLPYRKCDIVKISEDDWKSI